MAKTKAKVSKEQVTTPPEMAVATWSFKGRQGTVDMALARRVWDVVGKGLSCGLGNPTPGQMCVEAAVCYALGIPHDDEPPCVGVKVREAKIALNDKRKWRNKKARALGMRDVAIAQLGSNEINQRQFVAALGRLMVKRVVPYLIRHTWRPAPWPDDQSKKATRLWKEKNEKLAALIEQRGLTQAVRDEINGSSALDSGTIDILVNGWTISRYSDDRHALFTSPLYGGDQMDIVSGVTDKAWPGLLKLAAGCILDALRECGSPGVQLLDQLKKEEEKVA